MDVQALEELMGQPYPLAAEVARALEGAVFPLSREEVVWVARENDAGQTLLSLLSRLPEGDYASLEAVQASVDLGAGAPRV